VTFTDNLAARLLRRPRPDTGQVSDDSVRVCRRCSRPVSMPAADYDTFEQMHYVCFHYEFEHDPADVDAPCRAGGCPSEVAGGREVLLGALDELLSDWSEGQPASWDNTTLPGYLEALRAWVADSDGYYLGRKSVPPSSPAVRLADGLRAARIYE
jgi:hypothetical protein